MNNREWYALTIQFCQLSQSCASCPYHLLSGKARPTEDIPRPCFSSEQNLIDLDRWMSQEHEGSCIEDDPNIADDHQWLQELLRVQFHEKEAEEDFLLDDDLF